MVRQHCAHNKPDTAPPRGKAWHQPKARGYLTLISVLAVGAVVTTIAIALLSYTVIAAKTSTVFRDATASRTVAAACVEEALEKLRESSSFSGNGTLTIGTENCKYTVTIVGTTRSIEAEATYGNAISKQKITVAAVMPKIKISSWEEVPDF